MKYKEKCLSYSAIKLEKTGLVQQSMDIMPISYTKSQKMHLENVSCRVEQF